MDKRVEWLHEQCTTRWPEGLKHSGGDFYDHCVGVAEILQNEMNAPDYICMGGLYHSCYGTVYYGPDLGLQREQVREVIGEQAEEVAWQFCRLPHPRIEYLRQDDYPCRLELLLIELANYLEQARRGAIRVKPEVHNDLDRMIQDEIKRKSN
tara:strand:- start:4629 stop:5084 length:456 start_codon:yes stop_codon:yes gene_type:complete